MSVPIMTDCLWTWLMIALKKILTCDEDSNTTCEEDLNTTYDKDSNTTCDEALNTTCDEDLRTTCDEDSNTTCDEDSNTTCDEDSNTTCDEVHIDSLTAVYILNNRKLYLNTITRAIIDLAPRLTQMQSINWILAHTRIPGYENADQTAK